MLGAIGAPGAGRGDERGLWVSERGLPHRRGVFSGCVQSAAEPGVVPLEIEEKTMLHSSASSFRSRIAVLAIAALTAAAAGQPRPAEQPDPLSGPKVRGRDVPGVEGRFGGEPAGPQRARRALPVRVFEEALGALRGPEAPADLRLSVEQEERVDALLEDYRARVRAYLREHRGELGGAAREPLRRALREGRAPRRRGGPDAPAMEPGRPMEGEERARERLAELRQNMPRFDDWQVKVWAELRQDQRKAVESRMEEMRRQIRERMGEEYVQRRVRAREGEPAARQDARPARPQPAQVDGMRGPAGPAGEGAPPAARQRVRRIVEQLAQLPPEEREQILSRLEEELTRRMQRREGRGGSPAERPRKPL